MRLGLCLGCERGQANSEQNDTPAHWLTLSFSRRSSANRRYGKNRGSDPARNRLLREDLRRLGRLQKRVILAGARGILSGIVFRSATRTITVVAITPVAAVRTADISHEFSSASGCGRATVLNWPFDSVVASFGSASFDIRSGDGSACGPRSQPERTRLYACGKRRKHLSRFVTKAEQVL